VDTSTVDNSAITFEPNLDGEYTLEWLSDSTARILINDSTKDFRHSCSYTMTISDQVKDTSGSPMDGDKDGTPGGAYKFLFKLWKPKYTLPGKVYFYGYQPETKKISTILTNHEKRPLIFKIAAPPYCGNNEWSYGLISFIDSIQTVYLDSMQSDTVDLMNLSHNKKGFGSFAIDFRCRAYDLDGRFLDTVITSKIRAFSFGDTNSNRPPGGPGGPGGDQGIVITGGDDNWSISDPHYPAPWLIDDASDVGLLLEGYSESCGHLLGRYGIATVPVESESLLVLSNMDRSLSDLKVLVIPTNGLRGMENWQYFWQRIEEYISNGGYLIVLDQPYGNLYSRLPGSPQGRGFEEDQSCNGWFTRLNDGHPVTAHSKYKMANNPTDGYFTHLPDGSQIHATRIMRGGAASA
jgi:hypothetical protein